MPRAEALNEPLHRTGLTPPGKPEGNGRATPERKISSLPETGTIVIQVSPLNEVVAQVAVGLKVITASGTGTVNG
jgi:hypothetical protein